MDDYFDKSGMETEEIPAEGFYNKHYIKTRDDNSIIDAFSDGPFPQKDTADYILFNNKGGYQLRLIVNSVETEENPAIYTEDGIPLYKWVNGKIAKRKESEISAERSLIPPTPPSQMEQLRADVDYIMVMSDLT